LLFPLAFESGISTPRNPRLNSELALNEFDLSIKKVNPASLILE